MFTSSLHGFQEVFKINFFLFLFLRRSARNFHHHFKGIIFYGIRAYSGKSLKKGADLSKFPPLSLPITIPPYESKITTLVFRYDESLVEKNITINVLTSRGTAKFNRFVSSSQISQLDTGYAPPQLDEFD